MGEPIGEMSQEYEGTEVKWVKMQRKEKRATSTSKDPERRGNKEENDPTIPSAYKGLIISY